MVLSAIFTVAWMARKIWDSATMFTSKLHHWDPVSRSDGVHGGHSTEVLLIGTKSPPFLSLLIIPPSRPPPRLGVVLDITLYPTLITSPDLSTSTYEILTTFILPLLLCKTRCFVRIRSLPVRIITTRSCSESLWPHGGAKSPSILATQIVLNVTSLC